MTSYTLISQKNVLPVDDTIEKQFNIPLLLCKIHYFIGKNANVIALNIKKDMGTHTI